MIITSQGLGHFTSGINNQDFGFEMPHLLLVLDGCSEAKYSEIGTRLFVQLFSRKEECDKVEKFEDNVKKVFEDLMEMMKKHYPTSEDLEQNFIMENLLFTIIACFETEEQYIVKLFGDGYIFTQNQLGLISYMKFSYGKRPPYYVYKYCDLSSQGLDYSDYDFKTFYFDKKIFSKVGIASDGMLPIVKGEIPKFDDFIQKGNHISMENLIKSNKQKFFDDVTIGMIGGN